METRLLRDEEKTNVQWNIPLKYYSPTYSIIIIVIIIIIIIIDCLIAMDDGWDPWTRLLRDEEKTNVQWNFSLKYYSHT